MLITVSRNKGTIRLWDNEAGAPSHVIVNGRLA